MEMEARGWRLDELAHAGEEHLDPAYVETYDRKAQTDPTHDLIMQRELGLDKNSVLIDYGAGTGTFALAAAPFCGRVTAVDLSSAMLSVLQAKADRQAAPNLEIAQGGFLTYEHQGELADFVYSRNALHHVPDFWKAIALQRVASMLKVGGVLQLRDLVYSFDPGETERVIAPWLAGAAERPEDGWTRAEYETHLREEFSTFSWLLEPMLERAGFEIRQVEHSANRIYSAYTCLKR